MSALQVNSSLQNSSFTVASVKRWSCGDRDPPKEIEQVKSLHVYDFDNTLFATPLPSRQLWKGEQIGQLQSQDAFAKGGWWHDLNVLATTGQGVEKEEPRAWAGWWNEEVVQLVELSMKQPNVLTVLLTGRAESTFQDLIKRILASRRLNFDMVVLKPQAGPSNEKFASTMKFKQAFLNSLMNTYSTASEIRLYEDRVKHVRDFREFFARFNQTISGSAHVTSSSGRSHPIKADVVEVAEKATTLEPVAEIAAVQRMINAHNAAFAASNKPLSRNHKPYVLRRTVFYTGYLISPKDSERLLHLPHVPSSATADSDIRYLANNIMIRFGPTTDSILAKAGGIGHKVTWRCVAIGSHESKVWAARLEPIPPTTPYYTESQPTVVLALRGNARPFEAGRIHKWVSLSEHQQLEFDSVVGEKVQLRIEEERQQNSTNQQHKQSQRQPASGKRSVLDDDFPPLGPVGAPTGPSAENRKQPQNQGLATGHKQVGTTGRGGGNNRGGTGKGGKGPGQGRGFRGGGRGKGGYYHSLDDVGGHRGGGPPGATYDGSGDMGGLTY